MTGAGSAVVAAAATALTSLELAFAPPVLLRGGSAHTERVHVLELLAEADTDAVPVRLAVGVGAVLPGDAVGAPHPPTEPVAVALLLLLLLLLPPSIRAVAVAVAERAGGVSAPLGEGLADGGRIKGVSVEAGEGDVLIEGGGVVDALNEIGVVELPLGVSVLVIVLVGDSAAAVPKAVPLAAVDAVPLVVLLPLEAGEADASVVMLLEATRRVPLVVTEATDEEEGVELGVAVTVGEAAPLGVAATAVSAAETDGGAVRVPDIEGVRVCVAVGDEETVANGVTVGCPDGLASPVLVAVEVDEIEAVEVVESDLDGVPVPVAEKDAAADGVPVPVPVPVAEKGAAADGVHVNDVAAETDCVAVRVPEPVFVAAAEGVSVPLADAVGVHVPLPLPVPLAVLLPEVVGVTTADCVTGGVPLGLFVPDALTVTLGEIHSGCCGGITTPRNTVPTAAAASVVMTRVPVSYAYSFVEVQAYSTKELPLPLRAPAME